MNFFVSQPIRGRSIVRLGFLLLLAVSLFPDSGLTRPEAFQWDPKLEKETFSTKPPETVRFFLLLPKTIADESGTRTITYDRLRRKDEDYGGAGALSGYSIKRFHTDLNLERILVQKGNEVIHWVGYGYNGFNQLGAVESPGLSVSYFAYETGTGAPEKFDRNGLRTVRRYDERMRLEAETTGEDWEFTRTFTSRSQIESESLNGNALWTMGYGENGELESCSGPNGSYGYGFDAIGNRNGWGFGPGNEITWRSHALLRFLPVRGSVHPLASVELELATVRDAATLEWIWGSPAALATDAAGRFEHVEWPVGDEREFGVRVRGRITGGGYQGADRIAEEERTVFLPPVDFNPVYDGAGNLDHDWQFDYQWNGSNQLTHFHTITNQVADQYEVDMVYDAEGRRVRKTVTKNGELEIDTRFLYDGWNLLAEIVVETDLGTGTQTSWERFYTWGLDVSDSMGGAGGIGGLLSIYDGRTKSLLLPVYDGRGNIKALIDDRTRRTVARYEYDPFGRLLRAEGPAAEANPFRWQTKYRDAETGFYYFGYRYYEPSSARWISRDPIGEAGGINLYHYCHNDPINKYDYLGLEEQFIFGDPSAPGFTNKLHGGREIYNVDDDTFFELVSNGKGGIRSVVSRIDGKPYYVARFYKKSRWHWLTDGHQGDYYTKLVSAKSKRFPTSYFGQNFHYDGGTLRVGPDAYAQRWGQIFAEIEAAGSFNEKAVFYERAGIISSSIPMFFLGGQGVGYLWATGTTTGRTLAVVEGVALGDAAYQTVTGNRSLRAHVLDSVGVDSTVSDRLVLGFDLASAGYSVGYGIYRAGAASQAPVIIDDVSNPRAFNPADFADEVAWIRAQSTARHGLDTPMAQGVVGMADDFWAQGNRVVSLDRLQAPPTRLFANTEKLTRHGAFDMSKYTPIVVEELPDGTLEIMSGMTRVENARRAGMTQLPAFVYPRR